MLPDEVKIGSRETAYMLEVMQAYQNGKVIESLVKGGEWKKNDDPHWNWDFEDYRVRRKSLYHVTIEKVETTFLEVEATSKEEAEVIAYDKITPADFPPNYPDYRVTDVSEMYKLTER